jgi:sulfur carrier protein
MHLTLNGFDLDVGDPATLDQVVATATDRPAGVAAAVNGALVTRRDWPRTVLRQGDRVEVVVAAQGG